MDELEETLSLCDLPLYSDQSVDWDQEFSLTSNSTSSSNEDYFEFFSQELRPSAAAFPPENIIFCGKLIPYKQLPPCKKPDSSNQSADQIIKIQTKKTSCRRFKNGNNSTTLTHNKMYNTNKLGSRRKVKWYFFLFGIPRFSPVVELTDIRSRQSRRRCRSPPPTSSLPPMFGFRNDEVISDRRWGLWGLIRALSCGGNHHPTAVATVAAGGGSPPE